MAWEYLRINKWSSFNLNTKIRNIFPKRLVTLFKLKVWMGSFTAQLKSMPLLKILSLIEPIPSQVVYLFALDVDVRKTTVKLGRIFILNLHIWTKVSTCVRCIKRIVSSGTIKILYSSMHILRGQIGQLNWSHVDTCFNLDVWRGILIEPDELLMTCNVA